MMTNINNKNEHSILLNYFNKPFEKVILDANVFLLYLVGLTNPHERISHPRLSEYSINH